MEPLLEAQRDAPGPGVGFILCNNPSTVTPEPVSPLDAHLKELPDAESATSGLSIVGTRYVVETVSADIKVPRLGV